MENVTRVDFIVSDYRDTNNALIVHGRQMNIRIFEVLYLLVFCLEQVQCFNKGMKSSCARASVFRNASDLVLWRNVT